MTTTITRKRYLGHLHETHYDVRSGKHSVRVVVDETSGLYNVRSLTVGKGWAGAASEASNAVRAQRYAESSEPPPFYARR